MKKLMVVLFVLGISLQSFAGVKEKDVIGSWKYKVESDQGDLTGLIKIEKKDGKLAAVVETDDGEYLDFSKVELRDNDILYMEIDTGSELLELTLTVKGKVLDGELGTSMGSFPMTAEKVE